jgi:ferric-dicitrate binding protein FerR (iron transport regulator)
MSEEKKHKLTSEEKKNKLMSEEKKNKLLELLESGDIADWIIQAPDDSEESDIYIQQLLALMKHVKTDDQYLSPEEKTWLFNQIAERTIRRKNILRKNIRHRRVWRTAASIAASVAILVASIAVIYSYHNKKRGRSQQNIENAQQIVGNINYEQQEKISLVRSGAEAIQIEEENAEIIYDNKGNVNISSSSEEDTKASSSKDTKASVEEMNKLYVPYGKRSSIVLSDGSKVWLNSGSELEFPSVFKGDKNSNGASRHIRLKGEAYLEVAADTKPFIVHTGGFDVHVHGTKFNITAYTEEVENQSVVLVEGAVEVAIEKHEPVILAANERLTIDNLKKHSVDVNEYISWKDNILILNRISIADILPKIGRYYNITFDDGLAKDLLKKTCTGKLYLSAEIDDIMLSLSSLSKTIYRHTDNKIILISDE